MVNWNGTIKWLELPELTARTWRNATSSATSIRKARTPLLEQFAKDKANLLDATGLSRAAQQQLEASHVQVADTVQLGLARAVEALHEVVCAAHGLFESLEGSVQVAGVRLGERAQLGGCGEIVRVDPALDLEVFGLQVLDVEVGGGIEAQSGEGVEV